MAEVTPIGRRLRELRESAGVSALSLSLAGGFARDHVRKVEAGDIQNPSADFLSGVAVLLGVSLDWLIDGRGTAPVAADLDGVAGRIKTAVAAKIDAALPRSGTEG
jgi:transcriptional regulator with XRE-family HTH domain